MNRWKTWVCMLAGLAVLWGSAYAAEPGIAGQPGAVPPNSGISPASPPLSKGQDGAGAQKAEPAAVPATPADKAATPAPVVPAVKTVSVAPANSLPGAGDATRKPDQPVKQRLSVALLDSLKAECAPLATIKKESGFFGLFSRDENPVLPKCIDDLGAVVQTFWSGPEAPAALHLQSELYKAAKDVPAEAAALAKLVYVFNDSSLRTASSNRLLGFAVKELKGDVTALKVLANGSDLPERSDRYAQFIMNFSKLESDGLMPLLRRECDEFIRRYPDHSAVEAILSLKEGSYSREKRYELAAAGLRHLISVYPDSAQRPARMVSLAGIYDEQLKKYDQAVIILEKIAAIYPDKGEALTSYQRAARIYAEKLDKHPKALELLNKIVERYPKDEAARSALEYQAQIYADNLRDYGSAVKACQRLADMFKGDAAVSALAKATELARRSMKDYNLQIEIENRLVTEYPKRPEAIEALYDIGETHEDKLKNLNEALATYQALIRAYPDSKQAIKARNRIDKLTNPK